MQPDGRYAFLRGSATSVRGSGERTAAGHRLRWLYSRQVFEKATTAVGRERLPVTPRRPPSEQALMEKLLALDDETRRAAFLSRNRSLLRTDLVTKLTDQVREKVRVDVLQALRLADAALDIAHKLDDKGSLARALRAKANALYAEGKHAAAVDLHEQAAALFEAVGETHEVARTLSGSIQPLLLMGEYNRAFAAGDRARNIFAAEGNTWRLARLEINIGNIYYRQDRFAEALACYESAYQGLPAQQDPEGVAAVLSNMATCYISLMHFPRRWMLTSKPGDSANNTICRCW